MNQKTLFLAVQAIKSEIRRLKELSEENTLPQDEELLVDYENALEELSEIHPSKG